MFGNAPSSSKFATMFVCIVIKIVTITPSYVCLSKVLGMMQIVLVNPARDYWPRVAHTMQVRESASKTGRNLSGCNASWWKATLFALTDIQPRSSSARRRRFTVIISHS